MVETSNSSEQGFHRKHGTPPQRAAERAQLQPSPGFGNMPPGHYFNLAAIEALSNQSRRQSQVRNNDGRDLYKLRQA
jgi:hypothetical protein